LRRTIKPYLFGFCSIEGHDPENEKLEKEIGETLVEKQRQHRTLRSFAYEVWEKKNFENEEKRQI
jgi:hypothetical protein